MGNYSNRIIFENSSNKNKSSIWKLVVIMVLLVALGLTSAGTIFYKAYYAPKPIELGEIQALLEEAPIVTIAATEEIKKDIPYNVSYINDLYIIDAREEKYGEMAVDVAFNINYPAAYVTSFGTAVLKYKRGWYVENLINVDHYDIQPLFSAGETFLGILSKEIYREGMFIFNGQKYGFAKSYVDSLCVMSEEGDLDYTEIEIAPYNKDGRVDIVVGMKFNFDIWEWELVDFKTVGTR